MEDAKFPRAEIEAAGFSAAFFGQKTYNGVAILSKAEGAEVSTGIPGFADEQKRVIAATVGGVPPWVAPSTGSAPGNGRFGRRGGTPAQGRPDTVVRRGDRPKHARCGPDHLDIRGPDMARGRPSGEGNLAS